MISSTSTMATPISGKSVVVAYTGTPGTTSAMPAETKGVRVLATTDCWIEIGANPTAAANTGLYIVGLVPEYFEATNATKVSAIQVTAPGNLYVTPF